METSRILHFSRKKVKVAFHDFFFQEEIIFKILFILFQYSRGKGERAITTETCIKKLTRQRKSPKR